MRPNSLSDQWELLVREGEIAGVTPPDWLHRAIVALLIELRQRVCCIGERRRS